jgi:hypothetical protein
VHRLCRFYQQRELLAVGAERRLTTITGHGSTLTERYDRRIFHICTIYIYIIRT